MTIAFSKDNGWHKIFLDDSKIEADFFYFDHDQRRIQNGDIFNVFINNEFFDIYVTDKINNQYFGKIIRKNEELTKLYQDNTIKTQ
jgi:hypothetical protein